MSNIHQELIDALNAHAAALNKFVAATAKAGTATTAAASGTKPAGAKPAAGKKLTVETVKKEFGDYLSVSDKEVRKEHISHVTAINEYFNVAKATDLEEDKFAEALHYLSLYKKGLTPTFSGMDDEGEEAGADEGGESLV